MAELKIKKSTAGSAPTTLEERTLGIHSDNLYFGSSTGTAIKLAKSSDIPTNYVSTTNAGVQSIAGGLVIGGTSATATAKGRIMVTGHTNPLVGLQAIDGNGNKLDPFYFQVVNNVMYLGPTSTKALAFDKDGNVTAPATLAVNGTISEGGTLLSNKYQPKGNYLTSHQDISGKMDKIGGTFTGPVTFDGTQASVFNIHPIAPNGLPLGVVDIENITASDGGSTEGGGSTDFTGTVTIDQVEGLEDRLTTIEQSVKTYTYNTTDKILTIS